MKKYIHYGHKKFEPALFQPIVNIPSMVKPMGGLWASDINAAYGWVDWCKENGFRKCKKSNSFTFSLAENAKILTINSMSELSSLPTAEDLAGLIELLPKRICLDFEQLSRTHDAIEINLSKDFSMNVALECWDCDTILIMNPDVIVI